MTRSLSNDKYGLVFFFLLNHLLDKVSNKYKQQTTFGLPHLSPLQYPELNLYIAALFRRTLS